MLIYKMPTKSELVTRGLIAIAIGVLLLAWPGATWKVIATLFAALLIIDALVKVVRLVRRSPDQEDVDPVFFTAFGILLDVVVAVLVITHPGFALKALVVIVGIWAIISGAVELWAGLKSRGTRAAPVLAVMGLISVVIGIVFVTSPDIAVATVALVIGFYALISGGTLLALAFFGPESESQSC